MNQPATRKTPQIVHPRAAVGTHRSRAVTIDGAASATRARTTKLATANQQLRLEIEQRKRAEAVLAGENRVLELIAGGAPPAEVLAALARVMKESSPGVRCLIRTQPDDAARPPAAQHFGDAALAGIPSTFPADPRQRCWIDDACAIPDLKTWAGRRRVHALSLEPIVGTTGQVLGAVIIAYAETHLPSPPELETGAVAARLAGIIIDRAQADDRSRKHLGELAHVARLATMGEMASGLAHELNQPLCAIVNYTEACLGLLDDQPANSELRAAMAEVARQAERAGLVIRRLREFVRHREPQRLPLDVNGAVREVLELMARDLRQHEIKVTLRLGQRLPPVSADSIQIQQVLVNLVRNALEAMATTPAARRRLRIKTCRRRGVIEVGVEDCGRGIDPDARDQVFESFFTTKQHGLGMGLSISRSIIELHEGRIGVRPNPTSGVTFYFTLPADRRIRHDSIECDRVRRR